MKTIRFQNADYLLAGEPESGGPIATVEQYENGVCSFAFLSWNGDVMQHG